MATATSLKMRALVVAMVLASANSFAPSQKTQLATRRAPQAPLRVMPAMKTTFDPADNRASKVNYFNGPGANANSGLKKISAERSIIFLLDALPQVCLCRRSARCLRPRPTPA